MSARSGGVGGPASPAGTGAGAGFARGRLGSRPLGGRGRDRRRRRRRRRRGPLRARDRGERERLAGERGERLGGDPDGGLRAGAGVADGAARRHERAQVAGRRAGAVAALAVGVAAGRDEPLDRPGGRLGVGRAAGLQRVAAVGVLAAGEEARGAPHRRRAAAAGGDEPLQRRAGVVDPRAAALAGEVEAAVAVGLPGDPARPGADSAVAARAARRAQGEDRERGAVDAVGEGARGAPPGEQLAHEVARADPRRQAGRPQQQDRARGVPDVGAAAGRVGAQVVDDVGAAARDVARVAPRGREPEAGPAAVEPARALAGRAAEAAVAVLGLLQPAQRARRDGGLGRRRRGTGEHERGEGGGRERGQRAPSDLEALPVAGERADQRRAEDQAEDDVAHDMGQVERERGRDVRAERREAVVAGVGHPQVQVHHHAVADAGDGARGRQRAAPELAPGRAGEQRAADADAAPRAHLPRGPRPLSEEHVRGQRRHRPDREAGRAAERVAGQQHDVGRRLDVRQRRERDPAERGEGRERGDEREHARRRVRALVPREARHQGEAEHHERGGQPAHGATSCACGVA